MAEVYMQNLISLHGTYVYTTKVFWQQQLVLECLHYFLLI